MFHKLNEHDLLEILNQAGNQKPQKTVDPYPQTDISLDKNGIMFIELAVAGFKKTDISVEVKDNRLVVTGTGAPELESDYEYIAKNITKKNFERKVVLSETYLNGEFYADMEDGILTISITPSTPKANKIQIN